VGGIGLDAGAGAATSITPTPTPTLGPGSGSGSGASADAHAIGGVDPTTTVTTTITHAVAYTVTTCPGGETGCAALLGQVATRFETIVTTFCLGHEDATPTAISLEGVTAAGIIVLAASSASVLDLGGTGNQEEAAREGGQIPTPTPLLTTTAYPTTTIYEITSCPLPTDAAEEACTIGMTTTHVIAVVEMVPVQHVPPPLSSPSSSPAQPDLTPGTEYAPGGFSSTSNSSNTTGTEDGNNENHAAVIVAGAAPAALDDGKVDRRYLGVAFAFIWGIMILL
jgi:hypothetical protein